VAVNMKTTAFWDETPSSLVGNCERFVGIIRPNLQGITELADHSTKADKSNTVPKIHTSNVKE
jgi:hypothetical protein